MFKNGVLYEMLKRLKTLLGWNKPEIISTKIKQPSEKEIELSQKILNIILSDLEKFPPHEWTSSDCCNSFYYTFQNKCVDYTIILDYHDKRVYPSISSVSRYLTPNDRKKLFEVFESEHRTWHEQKRKEEEEQKLHNFFDDKQRVLCHD